MSWHASGRAAAQKVGIDPRYVRRWRWITKAGAVRRAGGSVRDNLAFVLADPEPDNFTYELANETELAVWVGKVCGGGAAEAQQMISEAREDPVLRDRVRRAATRRWWWSKAEPPFGKRLGWYAIARLMRPRLIVETGVHDGLGSLLLLRALELNAQQGADGRLVSFDVNPAAGWLVGAHPRWELRIQSSREGLPAVLNRQVPVGMFIHDSLHTYDNERWELATVAPRLADDGVLVSDNAHVTRALAETCAEFGLEYHEFAERPAGHFYPGGAVGAGRRMTAS